MDPCFRRDVMSLSQPNNIVLARVLGAQGLKGAVALRVFCADPTMILDHSLSIGTIKSITPGSKGAWNAVIDGVTDRTQAEKLKGMELTIPRTDLSNDTDEDEYYVADLIGLTVLSDGRPIGTVLDVPDFGAGELLDIRLDTGRGLVLPFRVPYVGAIDMTARTIAITEFEGFL
jgi:16S rRNA processing protein RimM